jgi:hypothetical protein
MNCVGSSTARPGTAGAPKVKASDRPIACHAGGSLGGRVSFCSPTSPSSPKKKKTRRRLGHKL